MKQNGAVYNFESLSKKNLDFETFYYDPPVETPLRVDAFSLSRDEKINLIGGHFKEIMKLLGLDYHLLFNLRASLCSDHWKGAYWVYLLG